MKVAIFHDYITTKGGGERVLIELAKKYNADIYTGYIDRKNTYKEFSKFNIITPKFPIPRIPYLKQWLIRRWFERLCLMDKYDIHICYGLYTVYGGMHNRPSILYANTVSKTLFGKTVDVEKIKQPRKFFIKNWRRHEIPKNIMAVRNFMNKVVSISDYTKKIVKTFYGVDSDVVYPMTLDITKYTNKPSEGYYLCVSRLAYAKRVDVIIKAFNKMPDKKLIIVGGGPEKQKLIKLAEKNIEFLGKVDDNTLLDLYSKCICTIYIPIVEDFGIVPIESMASGKPCIGVNEGALPETGILHEETGFFATPTPDGIVKAVQKMTPDFCAQIKNNCIEKAKTFDKKILIDQFDKILRSTIELETR